MEGGASPLLTNLILLRGENTYFHVQFVWQKLNNNLKIIFIQKILIFFFWVVGKILKLFSIPA